LEGLATRGVLRLHGYRARYAFELSTRHLFEAAFATSGSP
jgi:hypothetical protein